MRDRLAKPTDGRPWACAPAKRNRKPERGGPPGSAGCERCLFWVRPGHATGAACAAPLYHIIRDSILGGGPRALLEDVVKLEDARLNMKFGLQRRAAGNAQLHSIIIGGLAKSLLGGLARCRLIVGHQR